MLRIGVITISDKRSTGQREDLSGPAITEQLELAGHETVEYRIVPDELEDIKEVLQYFCDKRVLDVVFTTGGTGLSSRDVTPEATLQIADRQITGISEAMRIQTWAKSPRSMLSRGVAVTRGTTLVINLPGSPKAVRECLDVVLPVLEHAVGILKGSATECAETNHKYCE